MSIFDRLKKVTSGAPTEDAAAVQKKTFTFSTLPESLEEMQALPEAALEDPFQTAALTVCALCAYAADKCIGTKMLNWLRGPRPLSPHDLSFLNDRFRDGINIPFSYFKGAVPESNYVPSLPYTITIEAGPYADANPGYKKLRIRSGGADSPREIVLRQTADRKWYLWDQFLMVGIRQAKSQNPWAYVYTKSDSMQITTSRDLFLYREVSRTKKQSSSSSGSGSSRNVGGGKF